MSPWEVPLAEPAASPERPVVALLVALLVMVVVPQVPVVRHVFLPFASLGTLAHESGHALVAFAAGAEVASLEVYFQGGGMVRAAYPAEAVWTRALGSAAGLVGPPVVGLFLLLAGLHPRLSQLALAALGCSFLGITLAWGQGFALVVGFFWGLALLGAAVGLPIRWARWLGLLVAIELAVHAFRSRGYLLVGEGTNAGGTFPSDVANIARVLGGHHLMWGVAIGVLDVVLLGLGVGIFLAGDKLLSRDA